MILLIKGGGGKLLLEGMIRSKAIVDVKTFKAFSLRGTVASTFHTKGKSLRVSSEGRWRSRDQYLDTVSYETVKVVLWLRAS